MLLFISVYNWCHLLSLGEIMTCLFKSIVTAYQRGGINHLEIIFGLLKEHNFHESCCSQGN